MTRTILCLLVGAAIGAAGVFVGTRYHVTFNIQRVAQADSDTLPEADEPVSWLDDNGDCRRADGKMGVLVPVGPMRVWIDYIPKDDPDRSAKIEAAATAEQYARTKAARQRREQRKTQW
jgi:hypothetical protein